MKTLMLALAAGYVVFGVVLTAYQWREPAERRIPFFTAAKLCQGLGMILLCLRDQLPEVVDIGLANALLLSGFVLECWTMWRLAGRAVPASAQLAGVVGAVVTGMSLLWLSPAYRVLAASLFSALVFALAGWVTILATSDRRALRVFLGASLWLVAAVLFARAVWALTVPPETTLFAGSVVHLVLYSMLYLMMLSNGFGVLLLARAATDRQLREVLSEETAILETLPTGLCILRDRVIVRCNPAMEAMFGRPPGGLLHQSTRCLYASQEDFEAYGERIYNAIRDHGVFRAEVPFAAADGRVMWVWLQGTSIFGERAQDYAVFSLTDITEQKQQQEVLEQQKAALQTTLDRVKRLEGIISICMYCKKIRNEQESWDQLESYISQHTDAQFSHGICPECFAKAAPPKDIGSGI